MSRIKDRNVSAIKATLKSGDSGANVANVIVSLLLLTDQVLCTVIRKTTSETWDALHCIIHDQPKGQICP
jgi:hypothetical protein